MVIGLVVACSSRNAPDLSIDATNRFGTVCPDAPGTSSTIAAGTLVGADATRVFFRPEQGGGPILSWPKGGGVAAPLTSVDLGTGVLISHGNYYWFTPGSGTINVTDASAWNARSVPLASATSTVKQLALAPGGGVYVLTGCAGCSPPAPDTIELLSDGATLPVTIVTSGARISAIASSESALFWAQMTEPSQILRRDARTEEITTLVGDADLATVAGSLLVSGSELFDVAYDPSSSYPPILLIERRNLVDGALVDSYVAQDWDRTASYHVGGPPQWLTSDGDVYWTERTGSEFGAYEICYIPTGLFRLRPSDRSQVSIDTSATELPPVVDDEVVYYTYSHAEYCCVGHGHYCNTPRGPAEVRCYRKP